MAEEKKPDYADSNWDGLVRDREKKWTAMFMEVEAEGWNIIPLREEDGFTSRLALKPVQKGHKRGTLIVCAGGGYMFKSSNEAKPVADYFYQKGFNTAILDYHVEPSKGLDEDVTIRRKAGEDGLEAIRYLRADADALGILPDKIAIGGFSAGGILSGYAATKFDYGNPEACDDRRKISSRPDAALILYGAFSMSGIRNGGLFGFDFKAQAEACLYDPIRNIRTDSPPMFVFQTHKDDPRHALLFCYELACKGVPYELHTFEDGPHGGGLYDGKCEDSPYFGHTMQWALLAAEWLEEKGF